MTLTNSPIPHHPLPHQPLPHHPLPRSRVLRLHPVAAACASLLMLAGPAQAQQAGSEQSVTITGIRRAIESSVAAKRNADGVTEVISAEDLGKLPDVSIADSLARLPGLTGQRVGGRVQEIQIRGLSGQFAATLLNGRQQVTTGDNRSVEFDQFPSELINKVTVHKTADAALVGQGLSGTINMQSVRPLDLPGRQVALNARVEANSNGAVNADTSANGKRFSASYVDQFANRTIGVALGFAHLDTPAQELHYKAWGFSGPGRDCLAHPEWGCSKPTGIADSTTFLNGFEAVAISRKQVRDGLMGVLEFRPNKDLRSTVDLYYSKFTKDESYHGLMGGMGDGWGGAQGAAFSNVTVTPVGGGTNFVTRADVAGVPNMVLRNDVNTRDDNLKTIGWNTEYKLGGGWTATADLGYSNAKRDENVIETYAGAFNGNAKANTNFITAVPVGQSLPTLTPNLNYADTSIIKLSDPAGWGHDGLWKKPHVNDTIKSLNLGGKKDLTGLFSQLDFGLNYTTRTKEREMNELAADLLNGRAPIAVPAGMLQAPTSLSFVGNPGIEAHNTWAAINSLYKLTPQALDQLSSRNYEVFEKVSTAFFKLAIDTTAGGVPVRGNVGMQYVHTDQSSHGLSKLSGVYSDVTLGTTYNDFLPSLNLAFEFSGDTIMRVGVGKTMMRGRMDDMRAGANVNITKGNTGLTTWSGDGGNPYLQPWRATAYDLSVEKYLGKRSYVAAAAFYKDLKSYIYKQNLIGDFSAFPNTSNPHLDTPLNPLGKYTQPANGQGGKVHGVELSTSLDAGLWSAAMDGFGVIASVSVTASDIHPLGPGTSQKLEGLSGTVGSLTAYYEKNGFSARISERYRSSFRGEISGLHNAREFSEVLAERQVDLQLGYEFQTGSLKGVSLLLQVNNLSNAPYVTRQGNGLGDSIATERYDTYGRQTLLGVNYKF